MPYGRLDVFWPDGKFESYLLDTATVSVGRSNGSTIVLDTDTISRYHFSITNEDDQITVADMDSANGTFVDGVKLNANETRNLHGGEELQIGHLRMIYHAIDDKTTSTQAILDDTQRFVREDVGFSIEVYGPEISVPPGSNTSVEVSVFNNTEEDQRYTVQLRGLPAGWARINRPELLVRANESSPVLINFKPTRRSDTAPGDYLTTIIIALKDDPDKKIEAAVTFTVLPFTGFGVALATPKVTAYDNFKLHVHNQGSVGLPIFITGRSKDESLLFKIPQSQLILAAGDRQVVQGSIQARDRRLFGAPQEHHFDLLVRSRDEANFLTAVPGTYLAEAVLPRWAAYTLAATGVAIAALLLIAVILILQVPPPEPQVVAFNAATTEIRRGETLTVNWQVEDAQTVNLSVNDVVLLADADVTSAEIDTTPYSGLMTLSLEVINGEDRDAATLAITVTEPLEVETFEVEPSVLVRNVITDMVVSWRVEGAATTRIDGLQSLGPVSIEPSYGPEANFTISGVASENFSLTLFAEDNDGNTLEQVINIDLIDPECRTTEPDFVLYSSTAPNANVVSTLANQGAVVVVDRRDETGGWLRTMLPGGVEAWGMREGLDCVGFNPDLLRIAVTAPSEVPTAEQTPPVQASPTPTPIPTSEPTTGA